MSARHFDQDFAQVSRLRKCFETRGLGRQVGKALPSGSTFRLSRGHKAILQMVWSVRCVQSASMRPGKPPSPLNLQPPHNQKAQFEASVALQVFQREYVFFHFNYVFATHIDLRFQGQSNTATGRHVKPTVFLSVSSCLKRRV